MAEHADDDETPDLPPELEQVLRGLTGGGEIDPQLLAMVRGMGLDQIDPQMLQMVMGQVQAMFATPAGDSTVDATLATDTARKTVAAAGDTLASEADRRAAAEAVQVAGLWLDAVTDLSAGALRGTAWSGAEWVEATMPVWTGLVEPVAEGVTDAVTEALASQLRDLPEGALPAGMAGDARPGRADAAPDARARCSRSSSARASGPSRVRWSPAARSRCPSSRPPTSSSCRPRSASFAAGLEVDEPQARLHLAVREVARMRLFGAVPWLSAGLLAAVRDYAGDITLDTDGIEEAVRSIDPSDPQAVQEALQGRMFAPQHSPAQVAALGRLETLLALVEGWVDVVTERAVAGHLPAADALGEAVRRRRASGGPAEKAFEALVGLELRPRRLRDAANLFRALEESRGAGARDAAWRHPDLAPSAADLDDPLGYVERAGEPVPDDLDAELDALLRDEGDR